MPRRCAAARAVPVAGSSEVLRRFQELHDGTVSSEEADDFLNPGKQQSDSSDGLVTSQEGDKRTKGAARPLAKTLPGLPNTRVKQAAYVSSAVNLKRCPEATMPEFAVVGRSNVGKSSLINMLTGSRKLALTSKQPGARRTCDCMAPSVAMMPTVQSIHVVLYCRVCAGAGASADCCFLLVDFLVSLRSVFVGHA